MNSSIENAVSVCSFALPRAPSATDTRAIVAASGASTTFTKSNGPSVAHWCSTLAPSSSTSRLTSRSRSGFDFSVCTPWAVRLESMRYVGIAPPPRSGSRAYNPRGLIEVEERGPEEEHRRDDQVSEESRDPSRRLAGPVQEQDEHQPHQHEREQERGQRSRRVDAVGPGK